MSGLAAAGSRSAEGTNRADRWISRTAAATVAALAGIAGAVSYSHMRQLAQDHGQADWHAHAFPLSVDGIEIVASLVLLADRRAGRKPGWLPWAALAVGTAGSLAANVATAGPGVVSRVIAGWPALALLIAVKLLSSMLDHHDPSPLAAVSRRPEVSQTRDALSPASDPVRSRQIGIPAPGMAAVPAEPSGDREGHMTSPAVVSLPATVPGVADMLPAARAARDGLLRDGRPVTRDALASCLRQNGHPVRNSRLTALLHALRSETPYPAPEPH